MKMNMIYIFLKNLFYLQNKIKHINTFRLKIKDWDFVMYWWYGGAMAFFFTSNREPYFAMSFHNSHGRMIQVVFHA
jgi:hypothetical protein